MGSIVRISQSCLMPICKSDFENDNLECRVEDMASKYDISVSTARNNDFYAFLFHNGKPFEEEIGDEFSIEQIYDVDFKTSDPVKFHQKVRKLVQELIDTEQADFEEEIKTISKPAIRMTTL